MATIIRDKIKQPDGKNFKLLDAIDVEHSYSDADGSIQVTSVKEYLDELTEDIKTNAANIASLDDKYYTESEVDAMLEGKSDSEHVHDEYLTSDDIANKVDKSYVDSELVKKSDDGHTHEQYLESSDISHLATTEYVNENFALKSDLENIDLSGYETKDDAKSKLDEAKGYTDTKTTDMATTAVVDDKISTHNTSATAHNDIRELISALSTKVNNFLDVDDTTTDQLSEVLELINNNKGTLDSITSNKVNVSDIVDNLTTANASKVLSANQGVILKGLIDTLQETVDSKAASNHVHEEYLVASDISNKADTSYVDQAVSDALNAAKTDASNKDAVVLVEVQKGINTVQTAIDTHTENADIHITSDERTTWNNKADLSYVNEELDKKAESEHVHNQYLVANDIVNKTDKSYVDEQLATKSDTGHNHDGVYVAKETGKGLSTNDFTGYYKDKLDGIAEGANKTIVDTALSETSENPVQNKVVNTAIKTLSDSKVDKVDGYRLISTSEAEKLGALVLGDGGQVEISGKVNADNVEGLEDKLALKVDKVTGKNLSTNDFTNEYKAKLDSVQEGATNVVVDGSLSESSTNAIQNKIVTSEINSLKALVQGNTDAIASIDYPVDSVNGKTGAVVLTASDVGALPDSTVIPSIEGLASTEYVNTELAKKVDNTRTINGKSLSTDIELTASDVGALPANTTIPSIDGLATSEYVDRELDKKVDKVNGKDLSTNDLTDSLKASYDNAYDHSQISHAPANAQENVIEVVNVNGVALTISNKTIDIVVPTDNKDLTNGSGYLVANDIANKADTSYVDSELAKKVDSAEISHSSDTLGESATIKDGKLSIVVDAYTKAETLNKIQEKITEINGGESAGEVLGALNSYKETNDARVGALDAKIDSSIEEVKLDAANRDTVVLVEAQKSVNAVKEVLDAHVENTSIHITSAEREAWNNKSEFSGDYNDLTNAPNIYEDSSNNLVIADPDGNIIFKSDSTGFETTTLTAQTVIVSGTDVKSALDSIESNVTNITNGDIVVAKATYAESAGTATNANHANSADTANEATHATSSDTATNATNATNAENANHATNADTAANADHAASADTADDSNKFGGQLPSYYAKADHDHDEYVTEDELNGKGYLTSVPSEYITETELNAKNYLTEGDLSTYAKKTEIPEVVDNLVSTSKTAALSAAQGAALKAAIDSITGDMEELGGGDMMKAKYDTNNDGIVDNAEKLEGHPADYFAKAEHTHDYALTDHTHDDLAKADHKHDEYALESHTHDEYLTADDITGKADTSYVNSELTKKSDAVHYHDEYLVADDISGKTDKTYVDDKIDDVITDLKLDASNKDTVILVEAQKAITTVQDNLDDHVENTNIHITSEERTSWNNKADKSYVDDLINGLSSEGTADAGVVQAALNAHTGDKNNPHGVTAAQIGAYTTTEIDNMVFITIEDIDAICGITA